ncbi:MAG TPA: nucleotidyltransferase domain-containing protein [Pyrinomonadaceae bacterium]|nr:nucleotidyltransferase domain-containing protein [Pyrinomonadaceae bacterium]
MNAESTAALPPNVTSVLTDFVNSAKEAFGNDLRSVVLYGSGAEGKLRPTSDVNLILVLTSFSREQADQLREPLRLAQAAINLRVMFLLESELRPATEAFAVKFADIARRRRVLHGDDPFASVSVSRDAAVFRLKQTLLNLTLRMREAYVLRSLREEQLSDVIADVAGPLRSCASTLLELEGSPAASPKDALETLSANVQLISEARKRHALPKDMAAPLLFHLIDLARAMSARAAALK